MATDLTALETVVKIILTGKAVKARGLSAPAEKHSFENTEELAFGTGAGEMDLMWSDRRILAASAADNLDLAGGLTSGLSAAMTFSKVKVLAIQNRSDEADIDTGHAVATDADLRIGAAAANQFLAGFQAAAHAWDVEAGDLFVGTYFGTGWAVANGATDILKITNNDGADQLLYDIVIGGLPS